MSFYGATDAWDFTFNTYLRAGVVGPSGITFTRASVGYAERSDGIWQSFASGVARITDKGILIEGSRINRALYSRDLTNAAWTATNVTVARNQVGIDGTANSACSLTATAGNGTVLQAVTHASTGRYFSIWVKRITGTGTVNVTLDNGTTWTAVTVTSGWTRVGAAQTLANPTVGVRIVTSGDAIAVDFAQLEDAGFPSSPIATDGTAVTRAADSATVPLVVNYPASLFSQLNVAVIPGVNANYFNVRDNTGNERSQLTVLADQTFRLQVLSLGSNQAIITVAVLASVGSTFKTAARIEANNFRIAVNSTLSVLDNSGTVPLTPTTIVFEPSFSYIATAAILPALTDAQLQGITA